MSIFPEPPPRTASDPVADLRAAAVLIRQNNCLTDPLFDHWAATAALYDALANAAEADEHQMTRPGCREATTAARRYLEAERDQ